MVWAAGPCDLIAMAPVVTIGQGCLVFEASTPPTPASPRIEVGLPALRGPHTHGGTPSFRALSEAKAGTNQTRVKGAGMPP